MSGDVYERLVAAGAPRLRPGWRYMVRGITVDSYLRNANAESVRAPVAAARVLVQYVLRDAAGLARDSWLVAESGRADTALYANSDVLDAVAEACHVAATRVVGAIDPSEESRRKYEELHALVGEHEAPA